MENKYEFETSKLYNFLLSNILWLYFIPFLFCISLAYKTQQLNVLDVILIFAFLYIFILILWTFIKRSFHSIIIDNENNKIGFKFYRKNELVFYNFSEIDKIYLSNWLSLVINGKKRFLVARASPELIEELNRIKNVKWNSFARITTDRKFKRPSAKK